MLRSALSTSKRERRQEICGGDGGGNVTRTRDRGIQTFGFTLGRLNDALQGLRALRR